MQTPEYKEISNQNILFCVLNWGIGHATRSIPIIKTLLEQGNTITLMSDGEASKVLIETFPDTPIVILPSYNIKYSTKISVVLKLLFQLSNIKKSIRLEHLFVSEYLRSHPTDIIISDNRYGCYSDQVSRNILITHQLQLVHNVPFFKRISKFILKRYVQKFDELWIPDDSELNLSGEMAAPLFSIHKKYIGIMSAMTYRPDVAIDTKVLILLSGPEPNRSNLERSLIHHLGSTPYKTIMVAGDYNREYEQYTNGNFQFHSKAHRDLINQLILQSDIVVCRSGYSTLMDLWKLKKKNILCIPTLGQLEQEYLASYLSHKFGIKTLSEKQLDSIREVIDSF